MNKSKKNQKKATKVPSAYSKPKRNSGPVQRMARDGSILVSNEEYIQDLTGVTLFAPVTVPVNPGLASTFPWLSNLANNYEFYTFTNLEFEFRTTVGTTTAGSVALALDYDAADPAPTTRGRMLSYDGAVSGPIFSPLVLRLPKSHMVKMAKQRYTRAGAVPSGKDVKTYDVGNLFVSTICATAACGQLFVKYTVRLEVPHTPESYPWEASAYVSNVVGSKTAPFSGAIFQNADVADPVAVARDNTSFIIKKAGEYLISQTGVGTGLGSANLSGLIAATAAASDPAPVITDLTSWLTSTTSQHSDGKLKTYGNDTIVTFTPPAPWTTLTANTWKIAPFSYAIS